jgi:RNA-binding protein
MLSLSSPERRDLRAKAHALTPVVMIGSAGPTPAVIAEIGRALDAHALIKIRAFSDERDEREAWLKTLCESLGAAPVQHIGKVLVIYRPLPPESERKGKPAARRSGPRKTKKQMLASR